MTMKDNTGTHLSFLGIGLILSGPILNYNSDFGSILIQLGLALLIYVPFQNYKYIIESLGLIFLLYNFADYIDLFDRIPLFPNGSFLICLIAILLGIARHLRKPKTDNNSA